jgi:hypothetical protein
MSVHVEIIGRDGFWVHRVEWGTGDSSVRWRRSFRYNFMASDGQRWKEDAFFWWAVLVQFWVAMLDRDFVIFSPRWLLIGFRWRIIDLGVAGDLTGGGEFDSARAQLIVCTSYCFGLGF